MRITLQPALILHRRAYRETSVLLDILSEDFGRIALVARGVRGAGAKQRTILQPFNPILISWQGKTELMTLTHAESHGPPLLLQGDSLLSAFYLNELLVRILPKADPHPPIYTLYYETLLALEQQGLAEKTLRIFEKRLLDELGYGVPLKFISGTRKPIQVDEYYQYDPQAGFIPAPKDAARLALQEESGYTIFPGKSLLSIAQEDFSDEGTLKDAKRLMRLALTPLLGGQPIQSRRLFMAT